MSARAGVQVGSVGLVVRRRALTALVAVLVICAGVLIVSLTTGTLDYSLERVWAALTGNGTRIEELVVVDRRLSRVVSGALVGFLLGVSGALTQSVTRNPIASPDILGVTAGAGLAAVFVVTRPTEVGALTGEAPGDLLAMAALVGGVLTTVLILALSWRGGFDGLRLILVGIGVNALALAAISWMLTRSSLDEAAVATRWLTGSMSGARLDNLPLLVVVAVGCALVCVVLARDLASLRLGRELSSTLGSPAGRTEALSLVVAVVAVSAATSVAGPIGFVAFVAPQAALRLFGTAGPTPLAGGLTGAAMLVCADLVAQRLPVSLPTGVITAVVGAPVLLALIVPRIRRSHV